MRKVLYLERLDDGATKVSVYTGDPGKGTLKEYGVRSNSLIDRLRRYALANGSGGKYVSDPTTEAYVIME
jgi:hypothetical protein